MGMLMIRCPKTGRAISTGGDGAWEKFPNLKRLVDEISARSAAQKAVALKDRHKFKTDMDAEAMQAMFPHLNVKVA
jgi:GSH-dependent disulfide-bond oxidoreductase